MTDSEKYQKALEYLDKLIELFPDDWKYYFNRGNAYDNLENYDAAIADYTKAIELNPDFPLAYQNRERAYKDLKKLKKK